MSLFITFLIGFCLGDFQDEAVTLLEPDFKQARTIESLVYNIIGKKDREFLDGLLTFMNSYDL
jgi:hypothetical protein